MILLGTHLAQSALDRDVLVALLRSEETDEEARTVACKVLRISSDKATYEERVQLAAAVKRCRWR